MIVSIGAVFQAIGLLIFVYNLVDVATSKGKVAGHDPWDAWTLEWSTPLRLRTITSPSFPR